MPYDLSEVIDDIKSQLNSSDIKKTGLIHTSIGLCLADMSDRMQSVAMIESYTESVTAASRTITLEGYNLDMESIYYLKWGTGSSQKPLIYKPKLYFLEKYDDPSTSQGIPTYYTVLLTDAGMPIVKFDCPVDADTLTVYYFKEATPESMARFQSKIAVMSGALAYFHTRTSAGGQGWYEAFKEAVILARSSDGFVDGTQPKMILSKTHRDIRDIVWTLRNRRY